MLYCCWSLSSLLLLSSVQSGRFCIAWPFEAGGTLLLISGLHFRHRSLLLAAFLARAGTSQFLRLAPLRGRFPCLTLTTNNLVVVAAESCTIGRIPAEACLSILERTKEFLKFQLSAEFTQLPSST